MKIHEIKLTNIEFYNSTNYSWYGVYLVKGAFDYDVVVLNNTNTVISITFSQAETDRFIEYIKSFDNNSSEPTNTTNFDISDKEYTLKLVDKLSKFVK